MEITRELAKFNDIKFHDKEHKYYLNGKKMSSVTQLIGRFKQSFDTDYWSEKKAKERGILKEDILKEWKYKADFATQKGSAFHAYAENYLFNNYSGMKKVVCWRFGIGKLINKLNRRINGNSLKTL